MKAGAHAFLGWLARGTQEMFDPLHRRCHDLAHGPPFASYLRPQVLTLPAASQTIFPCL